MSNWFTAVNIVSLIAFALAMCGNILVNKQKKAGFVVWVIANSVWIVVNFMGVPNPFQVAMFVAYCGFNVHGWLNWRKMELMRKEQDKK